MSKKKTEKKTAAAVAAVPEVPAAPQAGQSETAAADKDAGLLILSPAELKRELRGVKSKDCRRALTALCLRVTAVAGAVFAADDGAVECLERDGLSQEEILLFVEELIAFENLGAGGFGRKAVEKAGDAVFPNAYAEALLSHEAWAGSALCAAMRLLAVGTRALLGRSCDDIADSLCTALPGCGSLTVLTAMADMRTLCRLTGLTLDDAENADGDLIAAFAEGADKDALDALFVALVAGKSIFSYALEHPAHIKQNKVPYHPAALEAQLEFCMAGIETLAALDFDFNRALTDGADCHPELMGRAAALALLRMPGSKRAALEGRFCLLRHSLTERFRTFKPKAVDAPVLIELGCLVNLADAVLAMACGDE